MKTILLLLLCGGISYGNSYFDQQENLYTIKHAAESQAEETQRAINQAAETQARAIRAASDAQVNAINRQTQMMNSNSFPPPMNNYGLTLNQLTEIVNTVKEDQKQIDAAEWTAVYLDDKREPLYLQSPDGKYKIGPIYVKPGVKWEKIK